MPSIIQLHPPAYRWFIMDSRNMRGEIPSTGWNESVNWYVDTWMNFRLRGGSDVVARGGGYREGETRGKGARARAERGASKMRESVCPLAGRYAPLPAGGAFPRGSLFHAGRFSTRVAFPRGHASPIPRQNYPHSPQLIKYSLKPSIIKKINMFFFVVAEMMDSSQILILHLVNY